MHHRLTTSVAIAVVALTCSFATAQNQQGGGSTFDRFAQFDTDGDGRLSKDELPERLADRLFEQGDTNKDGYLDKAELEALGGNRGGAQGRGQERGGGSFDGHMKASGRSLRRLSKSAMTAKTRQTDLQAVDMLQRALVGAKGTLGSVHMSEQAETKFGNDTTAYRTAFRLQLLTALAETLTLERAILAGSADGAKASIKKVAAIRNAGHDLFQGEHEDDDDGGAGRGKGKGKGNNPGNRKSNADS